MPSSTRSGCDLCPTTTATCAASCSTPPSPRSASAARGRSACASSPAAAGVSHAAPAHHFGDKTGLLTAIAVEGFELLGDALQRGRTRTAASSMWALPTCSFAVDHAARTSRSCTTPTSTGPTIPTLVRAARRGRRAALRACRRRASRRRRAADRDRGVGVRARVRQPLDRRQPPAAPRRRSAAAGVRSRRRSSRRRPGAGVDALVSRPIPPAAGSRTGDPSTRPRVRCGRAARSVPTSRPRRSPSRGGTAPTTAGPCPPAT